MVYAPQARHQDTECLERCLQAGLAHSNLEAEEPATLTLTNVLRFTRLSQLALQYLLAAQASVADDKAQLQVQEGLHASQGVCLV